MIFKHVWFYGKIWKSQILPPATKNSQRCYQMLLLMSWCYNTRPSTITCRPIIYCKNWPQFGTKSCGWPCHWARVGPQAQHLCGCRNWPHLCIRSRGWTCHHAWVGSLVTPCEARSRATPRVHDGESNHGSWCKNMVNFHSTTFIWIVAMKSCSFWSIIIHSEIGITSFKSTPPSSESMSLCTCDAITMVNEC